MTTNTFFTSDTHFWHKNIMNFCPETRRQANGDVERMNELLIENHNAKVPSNATVYFLGDVSFGNAQQTKDVLSRLNGHKHLIYGNHDKVIRGDRSIQSIFETVQEYKTIHIDKVKVVMFHYPMREWDQMHRGAYHLFGHVHGGMDHLPHGRSMDVGIDTRLDFSPWSWEEIDRVLSKRPILSHHGD